MSKSHADCGNSLLGLEFEFLRKGNFESPFNQSSFRIRLTPGRFEGYILKMIYCI